MVKKGSSVWLLRVIVVFVTLVSVLPFILMLVMTTHSTEEIFAGVTFAPGNNLLINLQNVWSKDFVRAYGNSLMVSVLSTVGCLIVSSMAGYALSMYKFRWRNAFYNFILITMMIPGSISMVGYMSEMRALNLTKTLIPLILLWLANGFGAFWMTQYFRSSFQYELTESARIDGCSEMGIFFKIALPCVKPALVTLSLMIFLWSWNNYLVPLILVNSSQNMTIPLFIQSLGNLYRADYGARITGLTLSLIPLIILFAIGSKSFIRGLMAGAVKG